MQLIKKNLLSGCKIFLKKKKPENEAGLMKKYLLKKVISEPDVKSAVKGEKRYFIQY